MKSSTIFSVLVVVLLLLLSTQSFSSAASNLETVCGLVGDFYITRSFCMETLSADPRSRTADAQGIAAIAANITLNAAAAITSKIESLLQIESSDETKRSLETCLGLYSDTVKSAAYAVVAIQAKQYAAARSLLDNLTGVAASCDAQPGVPAALTKDDQKFVLLAILADAVVNHIA